MADRTIKLVLDAEGNLKKFFTDAGKAAEGFEDKGKKALSGFDKALNITAGILGRDLIVGAFNRMSQAVDRSIEDFLEFDKAVSEVNSILGENVKLTKETTKEFVRFSSAFATSAAEQAKAFYQIVSAGVTNLTKATKLLNVANKAAVAGITDVRIAADILTSALASYGRAGLDATAASDILFVAVKEGKTTFEELATTVGRVAPLAAAAGISFDELAGTLAFLTKAGISTDEAVTGVRSVISALIKPTDDARKEARKMGIDLSTAAIKSKGFGAVLQDIIRGTKGSEVALGKLFPNIRALSAVITISKGDFSDFQRILNETANSAGATGTAFNTIAESSDFQFKKLTQTIENFGLKFLITYGDTIVLLLKFANDFVESMDKSSAGMDTFIDSLTVFVVASDAALRVGTALFRGLETAALGTAAALTAPFAVFNKKALESFNIIAKLTEEALERTKKSLEEETKLGEIAASLLAIQQKRAQATKEQAEAEAERAEQAALNAEIEAESEVAKAEAELERRELIEASAARDIEIEELRADAADQANTSVTQARLATIDAITAANATADKAEIISNGKRLDAIIKAEKAARVKREAEAVNLSNFLIKGDQERIAVTKSALSGLAQFQNAKTKEIAGVAKAAAIGIVIIDTAKGIQAAIASFAELGPVGVILGGIAAAAIGASGAGAIAKISGVEFQKGGEVPSGFPGDTFPARLTSGETVITRDTTDDIKGFFGEGANRDLLTDISERLASMENNVVVNIGSEEIVNTVNDAIDEGRVLRTA